MSLSREETKWHELYEKAPAKTRTAVDEAWTAVKDVFSHHGLPCDTTDRAEALVAMLYRYLIESLGEHHWGGSHD